MLILFTSPALVPLHTWIFDIQSWAALIHSTSLLVEQTFSEIVRYENLVWLYLLVILQPV